MVKKILIVEDFGSIRDFLCSFLKQQRYHTLGANDGQHAVEILQSEQVDLIISDFNMPRLTGMDLLMQVKQNQATKHIPVIFLTTEKNIDKMKKAREAGLFAWINKPYNTQNFLSNIERALAHERVSV